VNLAARGRVEEPVFQKKVPKERPMSPVLEFITWPNVLLGYAVALVLWGRWRVILLERWYPEEPDARPPA
jgi:hypothetical protein